MTKRRKSATHDVPAMIVALEHWMNEAEQQEVLFQELLLQTFNVTRHDIKTLMREHPAFSHTVMKALDLQQLKLTRLALHKKIDASVAKGLIAQSQEWLSHLETDMDEKAMGFGQEDLARMSTDELMQLMHDLLRDPRDYSA